MNERIINELQESLNINKKDIENTLKLLQEGNTIPFIARYRKEVTHGLNEEQIRSIEEVYTYELNLLKRKEDIIRLIDEKEMLTPELKERILSSKKLVELEDIYRPYKEKKKTKATEAINNGLEPLAKIILSFPNTRLEQLLNNYTNCKVKTNEEKLTGAKYIIAEYISDNANYRKWIRNYIYKEGIICSKKKKTKEDEERIYEIYYDYKEPVKYIKPHRILAINRGEKENILSVSINIDENEIISYILKKLTKKDNKEIIEVIKEATIDSYKRLIFPSIEREIRKELTDKANVVGIENFTDNVSKLLLTPPMKEITVLGFDPAFRTGCKLAVLDKNGNPIKIDKIYPHEPQNEKQKSKEKIIELINKYHIDVIAIGNGTASRESEAFIADCLKDINTTKYVIVSESGASVYSASPLAKEEFPNLDVSERSAISIGRRLQDPLSELVKIDPKSIGVGLYQHDLKQKELNEALTFSVSSVVNSVGVNINTASPSILSYISGLTKTTIKKIIELRDKIGKITSRDELKKALSSKTYEQAIGFIRINDAKNPLDKTRIHPESYKKTYDILNIIDLTTDDIGTEKLKEKLKNIDKNKLLNEIEIDKYTLDDIIDSLKEPLRDPRDEYASPTLKSDILTIDDLKKGMEIEGVVRNVIDFGAFIDIGLHDDGLLHISEISNNFIKHPKEVLSVGDIIKCYIKDIDKQKNRVSLTLKKDNIN